MSIPTPDAAISPNSFDPLADPDLITARLRFQTPENVVLAYTLAGPVPRMLAYLIDTLIRGGIILAGSLLVMCSGGMFFGLGFSFGVLLVLYFLLEWGYFVLCEVITNGQSPGKRAMGLRVLQERGYTISFWSSLLRNLVRGADLLPACYGVGLGSMILSPKFQRFGDRVARTIVIQERKVALPREPLILKLRTPLDRSKLSHFVPSDKGLALIDEFLSRRHVLTDRSDDGYARGHHICADLAEGLAERLQFSADRDRLRAHAMAFLADVYVTFLPKEAEEDPEVFASAEPVPIRRRRRNDDDQDEDEVELLDS